MKKRKRSQKVMTSLNTNQSNPPSQPIIVSEKPSFSHDQLIKALYYTHDFMERALVPFFLTDITAECMIKNKSLEGDAIYVGVRHNAWFTGTLNIIEAFAIAVERSKTQFKYEYEGVPIIVNIYKDHPCITGLNTRMWQREFFNLPNPYDEFLKVFKS